MSLEYKIGEELFYREDGGLLKVKVLENKSDKKGEGYRLRIIGVIRKPQLPWSSSPRKGRVFECYKTYGVGYWGNWDISRED